MTPGPGIAPGTHWWKASALTTAPTLLPSLNLIRTHDLCNKSTFLHMPVTGGSRKGVRDPTEFELDSNPRPLP